MIDPLIEIKKINIPILLLNGDKDIQVGPEHAVNLINAKPDAFLHIIPGMNHVLKEVKTEEENQQSYMQGNFPLSNELIFQIDALINQKND